MIWFTADTHFGHDNIIRSCNRPFASVEEQDETLIQNWNSRVCKTDHVYHLGDFAFRNAKGVNIYARRLNGKIHIIQGNHDKQFSPEFFTILGHYHVLKGHIYGKGPDDPQLIVLCHYPFSSWASAYHGSWHLFGHVHGRSAPYDKDSLRMDVGVDCNNFAPISYEEVKAKMLAKNWQKGSKDGTFPTT
jgi:calcineurin-like phosphoesterase family protein